MILEGAAEKDEEAKLKALQQAAPHGLRQKILAARSMVEGERKPVTVLFADIVGSTSIAEKLDPEDWREIVAGAHHRVGEAIYRYEGTITQLLGDGVYAFFGAPIAHEDDPARAVLAALDIQESIGNYRHELGEAVADFQMRVGINTGIVVIGDIGTDLHVEYLAFGDAVNVAARLESAADPGTILISERTHRLVAPMFETEALTPIRVKGKASPIPVYCVLSAKARPGKLRGIAGLVSPLVGREAEQRALAEALERLEGGEGGIVTIIGEAGIGKSRLVAELRNAAAAKEVRWVEGRCLSYGGSTPYLFWSDALREFLRVRADDDSIRVREKLREWLKRLCPDRFDRVFPYLGRLLSLPMEDEAERNLRDLKAEDLKASAFQAVETVFEWSAADHPLVLVGEDLHWADPTSVELMERILTLTSRVQLLILCIIRPEPAHVSASIKEAVTRVEGLRHTELRLDCLDEAEIERLVSNLLRTDDLPETLVGRIRSQAEGNPFYVEEIIRSLIDREAIARDDATGLWSTTDDLREVSIPDTLQGVLLARMDRLQEDTRRVLQMASVIGRRFDLFLVDRIAPLSGEALEESLSILEAREFVRALGEDVFAFKHVLTQDVAYQTLLKRQRRALHSRVGLAMEELYAPDLEDKLELLAYHFLRAEAWDKAWAYQMEAGRKAKGRFANQEAIAFFQTAMEVARQLPQLKANALAEAHTLMADVLSGINQYDDALVELEQALRIVSAEERSSENSVAFARIHQMKGQVLRSKGEYEEAIEEIQRGIEGLIGEHPKEQGALKIALASALTRQGELEQAQRWCEGGIQDVEAGGDRAELAHAYSLLGTIRRDQGDTAASLAHRQRSLHISQAIENVPLQMEAHNNLAVAYYDLGQLEEAVTHYEQSRELSERIGNLNTAARAEINLGEVHLVRGDWGEAEKAFRHALGIWERTGYALGQAYGSSNMGAVLIRQGKPEEALTYLERSQELFDALGARGFLAIVYRRRGAAQLALGDLGMAEELGLRSLELARELSMPQEEGAALRTLGEIYREKGRMTQAEEHLERSVEIFREAGVQYEEARALYQLAQVWFETKDDDRILPALERAIEQFRTLGAMVDLERAETLRSKMPF